MRRWAVAAVLIAAGVCLVIAGPPAVAAFLQYKARLEMDAFFAAREARRLSYQQGGRE